MLTKLNLTSLKQSVGQFATFGALQRISFLKKYLPATIIALIIIIGLIIGKRIASLSGQPINISQPVSLPVTITPSLDSSLTPLKQSVEQFNPQLPDPLMPEFNDSIMLEQLEN